MRKKLDKDIKSFGLTSAHHFGVLLLLSKGDLSQKQISDVTLADEPSTTRMLNRMIKKHIINKKGDEVDKRKKIVYITKKGKELLQSIIPLINQHNKDVEDLLSKEELKNLFHILNKIKNIIS